VSTNPLKKKKILFWYQGSWKKKEAPTWNFIQKLQTHHKSGVFKYLYVFK